MKLPVFNMAPRHCARYMYSKDIQRVRMEEDYLQLKIPTSPDCLHGSEKEVGH